MGLEKNLVQMQWDFNTTVPFCLSNLGIFFSETLCIKYYE